MAGDEKERSTGDWGTRDKSDRPRLPTSIIFVRVVELINEGIYNELASRPTRGYVAIKLREN